MSNEKRLFESGKLGDVEVQNRVFMAPLTRNRAHPDGTPKEMANARRQVRIFGQASDELWL